MNAARRIGAIAGTEVVSLRAVAGGDICRAYRAELSDGRTVFAKQAPGDRHSMVAAEAAGLQWLADGGAAVPGVLGADGDLLVLQWAEPVPATPQAARAAGRMIAELHRSGAPGFGAAPPGAAAAGWIGTAPMHYAQAAHWPEFFAEHRITPYLNAARRAGSLTGQEYDAIAAARDRVGRLCGPPVPPARLHGDLWGGNLLFSAQGCLLIDPAAHGGHPETDLAMLLLFPPPHAAEVIAGYRSVSPLAPGWPERIDLHQLYPLLVHAVLFGGGYGAAAAAAAHRLLSR